MNESTTKKDGSESDRLRYLESLLETKSGIEEAIILLKSVQAVTGDPDTSRAISVKLLDLEAENAKLQAELLAYAAGTASFRPPTQEEFEAIPQSTTYFLLSSSSS